MTYPGQSSKQVYFAERADSGLIKIGCSCAPTIRIKQLVIDLKVPIEVLAAAPAPMGFWDERRLHTEFADERVEGEWFSPSERVLAAVAHVKASGELPLPTCEDRDTAIIRRRKGGETLQSIANDIGITRERVRQIVSEHEAMLRHRKAA